MIADVYIVGIIVVGIALDIYLALTGAPNHIDTISARAKWIGWQVPALPYGVCMLASHFWLNWDGEAVAEPYNYVVLAGVGVFWVVAGRLYRAEDLSDRALFAIMLTAMVTGFLAGALLWPQRPISLH